MVQPVLLRGFKPTTYEALQGTYGLTKRELEVLELLSSGRTADYISKALFITENTAKTHRRVIYSKLGVHSKQEMLNLLESLEVDEVTVDEPVDILPLTPPRTQ